MKRKLSHSRQTLTKSFGLAVSASLCALGTLHAQNWTGASSSFWNQTANWSGGALPTTSQTATFDAAVANLMISLGANQTVGGLNFTAGATQGYTLGNLNEFVLTLNGTATNDIQIEAGSAAHSILSKLIVSGTQNWNNASSNAFTVGGDIDFGTATLTFTNAGSGGFVLGGASSKLTNTTAGDLTLTVANTGAATDLTLNGQLFITNSTSSRTLRLSAAAGSVVDINAVLSGQEGNAATSSAFAVSGGGTVNLNATKTYIGTTTINNNTTLNVNSVINNTGIWDIDGGTLNWNVTNTSMGSLYFGGGPANSTSRLNIAEGVVMNLTGTLYAESEVSHSGASFMSGGTLNLNATRTFEIRDSRNTTEELTISSNIANGTAASGISKSRNGTLILAGTNSFTGATTIHEGTLVLDYRTQNTNKISAGSSLTLSGGILWVKGHETEATQLAVSDLAISNMGGNQIILSAGSQGSVQMNVGAIARANTSGGTIRFHLLGNSEILSSATNTQSGILGSWATATVDSGDYFATVLDGKIKALDTENFSTLNSQIENQVGKWQSGANLMDEGDFVGTLTQMNVNSLRVSGASTLEVTDFLRIQSGGLLVDTRSTSAGIQGGVISLGANSNNYEFKVQQNSSTAFEITSSFIRYDNSAGGHIDLTKSGSGDLILSGYNFTGNRGQVASNGTVRVVEGTLILRGGHAISDNTTVIMDARTGATLKLEDDETIGTLYGGSIEGGNLDIGAHTLTVGQSSTQTFSGAIIGSGTLIKQSLSPGTANAHLVLGTVSHTSFTGQVIVNSGLLQLSHNNVNNLAAVTSITVNKSGSLLIDGNGISSLGNKINNTASVILNSANGAQASQIAFRGLSMRNDQAGSKEEIFGNLVLNSGANYALLEGSNASTSNVTVMTASGLTRNHQSTLAVRGNLLGAGSNRRTQLRLATASESDFRTQHMTGENGAAGTTGMSIVRWAIAQDLGTANFENLAGTTQTNLQLGNSLSTYINGQGFRALDFGTEYTSLANATSGFKNVRESLSSDLTGITSKTINALVINNASTSARALTGAGAGASLTLQSGTLLFTALQSNGNALPTTAIAEIASGAVANGVTVSGFNSGILTNSGEYVIFQNNLAAAGVTISSDFTSAAKFTKSGLGTLILTGNNSAITDVALNEGIVQISHLNHLGGGDGKLTFGGGTLKLATGFTGDLSTKEITIIGDSAQAGNNGGRMGTLDTNGVNVTFGNNLHGNGEFVKTGAGTLTLNAATATTHGGNFVVEQNANGTQDGTKAQLVLNNTGGNAIGGNLQIGAYTLASANGSAVVELARSEQILDSAVISFNGVSSKNAYFSLKGFHETVAGLVDVSGGGLVQVDTSGGTVADSTITLSGADDYFFNGQVRNRGTGSGGVLHVTHSGTGRQTFSGSNVTYTGLTQNTAGTLQYRNTNSFKGSIVNNAILEFEVTGTSAWNYTGVISGSGHFVKTGEGTGLTSLDGVNTSTGTITVKGGELTLGTNGKIDDTSGVEVYSNASFKATSNYTYYGNFSGTGSLVGNFTLSKKAGAATSTAELRPGASSQMYSSATAGNLLGNLTVTGNLTLTGGTTAGDNTGARAILQIGAATLNDASGISLARSNGTLATYLDSQATASWNALSTVDSVSGVTKHDSVTLTGGLTWDAGSTFRIEAVDSFNPVYGDVFDLFDWTTLLDGTADWGALDLQRNGGLIGDLYLPVLGSGLMYDLSAFAKHGLIAVVPEPSRMLTLMGAIGLVAWRRRRH